MSDLRFGIPSAKPFILREETVRKTTIFFLLLFILGCSSGETTPDQREAQIGISGLTQNFDGEISKWKELLDGAREANVHFLHLQTPRWSEAEPSPGVFDFSYFDGYFQLKGDTTFRYTLDVATPLGLGAVDVPKDISFRSFSDTQLISRYQAYLLEVLTRFPAATHLVLHTETAGPFFGNDADSSDFRDYCDFISEAAMFIRSKAPNMKVGIYGTKSESRDILSCLNRSTDFFGISYLADRGDSDHLSNLTELINQAGEKPVALIEVGIPTAPRLGGSEEKQSEFVQLLFKLLATEGDHVLFLSYYQFIDEQESVTSAYVPILFPQFTQEQQQDLIAFLSSLGLHRADRSPKPAWQLFLAHP